jgi:hypothetical protein
MEREQHELYEYARKGLKQKRVIFHFVLLFLASLFFLFVSTKLFNFGIDSNWYIYLITAWFFIFPLH